MPLIITGNSIPTQKLEEQGISQESELQKFVADHPECVGLDEIREDLRFQVLAREFPTESGPLDVLGTDDEGVPYIIETKLFKNPDRRRVLAQMLDYGAALWNEFPGRAEFLETLRQKVNQIHDISLDELLEQFAEEAGTDAESLLENIGDAVEEGSFRFVVLMDRLDKQLKNLIRYVNENSTFDIYGVTLEFYPYENKQIVHPRLFGAEVRKKNRSSSRRRKPWDETSFFQHAREQFSSKEVRYLKELYQFSAKHADRIDWGRGRTKATFNVKFDHFPRGGSTYTVHSTGILTIFHPQLKHIESALLSPEETKQAFEDIGAFWFTDTRAKAKLKDWGPKLGEVKKVLRRMTATVDPSKTNGRPGLDNG